MKRVLIVDDDFLVRTYLKQMIDWQGQGYYIVGDAKNGREAQEILERDGADIMIADVSMPIMDGIELTRWVKKNMTGTHILILSCHDDFVYVKEAMKLGIDDYLLKNNLTEETLLDALKKIKFEAEENNAEIERLAVIGRKKLQEDFYEEFETGKNNAKLERLAEEASLSAKIQRVRGLMLIPKNWQERERVLTDTERENFLSAFAEMILNACKNVAGDKIRPIIFASHRGGFFHWGVIVDSDREVAKRLYGFAKMYFNMELKIFLTERKENLDELAGTWRRIFELRADSFYAEEEIIRIEELPRLEIKIGEEMKRAGEKLLAAMNYSEEDFNAELKTFREKLLIARLHPEILLAFMAELFLEERRNIPNPLQSDEFEDWYSQVKNFLNQLRTRQGKEYMPPTIRLGLRYIEKHYHEDISQSDVADAVHLNASYFSTLFKKTLGKGFSDYLTEIRIEHVKERLAGTCEKIKDIATSEGFNDYQYFCKLFKRLTDLTPSQFREKFFKRY